MIQRSGSAKLTQPVTERDHRQGLDIAPVTLVEYGDYECPYCGNTYTIVKELQQQLGNQLCFVFRNFPLSQVHPHAEHAAEAAEAAAVQGKFWQMHDTLFEHQQALDDTHIALYAATCGLDDNRLMRALTEHGYRDRVLEDVLSGARSGVNGTPTFFINGLRHDDAYDLQTLLVAIESI